MGATRTEERGSIIRNCDFRRALLALAAAAGLLAACSGAPAYSQAELETAKAELGAHRTATAQAAAPHLVATQTPTEVTPGDEAAVRTPVPSLTGPHGDGAYVVGVEIAPGLWRSIQTPGTETQRFCYFARRKYDGILLGSYYGLPGPDLLIRPGDYEVEMEGCGMWVYMGER